MYRRTPFWSAIQFSYSVNLGMNYESYWWNDANQHETNNTHYYYQQNQHSQEQHQFIWEDNQYIQQHQQQNQHMPLLRQQEQHLNLNCQNLRLHEDQNQPVHQQFQHLQQNSPIQQENEPLLLQNQPLQQQQQPLQQNQAVQQQNRRRQQKNHRTYPDYQRFPQQSSLQQIQRPLNVDAERMQLIRENKMQKLQVEQLKQRVIDLKIQLGKEKKTQKQQKKQLIDAKSQSQLHERQRDVQMMIKNTLRTKLNNLRDKLFKRAPTAQDLDVDQDDEGMTCPVCFDPWTANGVHRLVSLPCGHLFGDKCIRTVIELCKECPICRNPSNQCGIRKICARKIIVIGCPNDNEPAAKRARIQGGPREDEQEH